MVYKQKKSVCSTHTDCPQISFTDYYSAGAASTATESVTSTATESVAAASSSTTGASSTTVASSVSVTDSVDSADLLPQDANDTAAITAANATNFFFLFLI